MAFLTVRPKRPTKYFESHHFKRNKNRLHNTLNLFRFLMLELAGEFSSIKILYKNLTKQKDRKS